jgi:transposase
VARERRAHPDAEIELWAMDEHRVGLIPILRRVWAPRGRRPRAVVRPRYEWLYLVAFVHPESGRTSFWIVPQLDAKIFAAVLAAFVEEQGFDERKRLLLVLDGAGWHTAGQVRAVPGGRLITQPPYSPELQPAERLWPISNEPLANRAFKTIAELEAVLARRCCEMTQMQDSLRRLCFYHWWPSTRRDTHNV